MKPWIVVGASVLFACGPEKGVSPATASGASDSSGEVGVAETGAAEASVAETLATTDAPVVTGGSTTGGEGTTGEGSTTGDGSTAGEGSTTGGEPAVPFVHLLTGKMIPSGVDEIPGWPGGWEFDCPAVMDPPCGTTPTLGEPQFVVDGALAAPETITIGSRVAVLIPFEDPACALRCGAWYGEISYGVDGAAASGATASNMPCSTEASGLWLGLDFGVIQHAGLHTGKAHMADICEALTEPREFAFTPK